MFNDSSILQHAHASVHSIHLHLCISVHGIAPNDPTNICTAVGSGTVNWDACLTALPNHDAFLLHVYLACMVARVKEQGYHSNWNYFI